MFEANREGYNEQARILPDAEAAELLPLPETAGTTLAYLETLDDVAAYDDSQKIRDAYGPTDEEADRIATDADEIEKLGETVARRGRAFRERVDPSAPSGANSSYDAVTKYSNEIRQIKLLPRGQDLVLARLAAEYPDSETGRDARRQLIETHLRLVVSIARKYVGNNVPLIDLIGEGNIGLMRAAQKYDYRRDFSFTTYATWWVRQAVSRAVIEQAE